ncbi:unnamed protein product, partial [Meganyctiphanes norvegica]
TQCSYTMEGDNNNNGDSVKCCNSDKDHTGKPQVAEIQIAMDVTEDKVDKAPVSAMQWCRDRKKHLWDDASPWCNMALALIIGIVLILLIVFGIRSTLSDNSAGETGCMYGLPQLETVLNSTEHTINMTEPRILLNNSTIVFKVEDGEQNIILIVFKESKNVSDFQIVIIIDRVDNKWEIKGTANSQMICNKFEKDWKSKKINTSLYNCDIFYVRLEVLDDYVNAHFSIGKENFILKLSSSVSLQNRLMYFHTRSNENTNQYHLS